MEWLTGYIIKICAAALISFVVDMLLPEGNIKRTARFCASLVITIIICAPLVSLFSQQQTITAPPQEYENAPDELQISAGDGYALRGRTLFSGDIQKWK